ncbi:hypothetical protein NW768_010969 [Fusarium equiseti]|uniref:Major facilitator superfamily (MFS) profile domain-containing protein n=1 Tax=Fusarium equiseti TaxID=61235 RepID=A0ABQ8QZA4_FUSEQ|nr:hypothetical protein NW768_010969 [Fusarium equiseti]
MWSFVQRRQIAKQIQSECQHSPSSVERRTYKSRNSLPLSSDDQVSRKDSPNDEAFNVRSTGEDDPLNPKNWPLTTRSRNIFIICFLVFTQCWSGAADSIGNDMASKDLHVSQVAENVSTAVFLFGVGTGALFAGPLSETVGRNPTYLVVAWANVAAPVIAPVASGWIVENEDLGWRWTNWVTLIISTVAFLVAFFFLPETHFPLLLAWKARELRLVTNDRRYISDYEQKPSLWKQLRKTLPLPATFFRSEPVIIVLGLYLVLLYVLLFSFLSGFDYIFKETYSLSRGYQGSCFAAIAAGATAFALCGPALYEWSRVHTERVRGASIEPEFRLWPAIVTAPFLPISLFWLGWTNYARLPIWSGLGACFLFGIVLMAIYVGSYEYITDSYGKHSAIALASITMPRYLIAGGMVMAARPMYEGIGVHWTMTLLGCIAVLLTPAPLLFWKYGAMLRERSPYATTKI